MAQQDRDLPEGTDTVIPGAMDIDVSGTAGRTTGGTTAGTTGRRGGRSKSATAGGDSESSGIMDKVKSGTDKLSEQAGDRARDFVGQGIERSSDALANVSKLIGETASGLDERLGQEYGDYARRAAETLKGTADRLAGKDPDEVIDDTRQFIRKSPGVALAGAAIVGFAIARLIKSGLSPEDKNDDDRTDSRS
ncbi:MAG TPA: hypothetical protein VMK31_01545 [Sphingomicrobium sp.]|nr:hypothetical protein [Sphingomicrobium sp.]